MLIVRRLLAVLAATFVLLAITPTASPALPDPTPDPTGDPATRQTIRSDQQLADGRAVVERGHVDIAPRLEDDGTVRLRVHDDSVRPSVWRTTDEVVFAVGEQAAQQLPDDPTYAFLGDAGAQVHVLPQTQQTDLVWVGWNTQDPALMKAAQRGVSLSLQRVSGPGALVVYLQSGTLGAPEVLWDSRKKPGQELWVDTNTHTHGNWVFTRPGVYAVELGVSVTLRGGQTVEDRQVFRFAVGPQTPEVQEEAFSVAMGRTSEQASEASGEVAVPWVPIALGGLGAAVLGAPLLGILRRRALRRRILEDQR